MNTCSKIFDSTDSSNVLIDKKRVIDFDGEDNILHSLSSIEHEILGGTARFAKSSSG